MKRRKTKSRARRRARARRERCNALMAATSLLTQGAPAERQAFLPKNPEMSRGAFKNVVESQIARRELDPARPTAIILGDPGQSRNWVPSQVARTAISREHIVRFIMEVRFNAQTAATRLRDPGGLYLMNVAP